MQYGKVVICGVDTSALPVMKESEKIELLKEFMSDKRNKDGVPYLIHNGGQPHREEDILELYNEFEPISGHYRLKDI